MFYIKRVHYRKTNGWRALCVFIQKGESLRNVSKYFNKSPFIEQIGSGRSSKVLKKPHEIY